MDAPLAPLAAPSTLTPSKLDRFLSCPLSFRYAYIDRLAEPPSIHQVRGTIVHRALQRLYGAPPAQRTLGAAQAALDSAVTELAPTPEVVGLGLDETASEALREECAVLISRYFELEQPQDVHPIGLELDLRCSVDGIALRGIIDRPGRRSDGEFVVVDYRTGRAPSAERARGRLGGVHFYALLCEQLLGQRPREVRLVYVRDRVVITETPTEQSLRGTRQRARAAWTAIERACAQDDFRPNPSRLCAYCGFRTRCPAMPGGQVPPTPAPARPNVALVAH